MEQKLQKEFKKVEDTRVAEASASAHRHTRQECDERSDEEIQVISSDDEEKHELPHHSSLPSEQAKQVANLPSPPEEPQNPQVPVPLLFRPWQTHIPQIQIRRSSISALQRNQQNNPENPNAADIALDNQQIEKVLPLPGTSYPVDYSVRSEVASQFQEHKFKKVEDTRVAEASASAHGHTRKECDERSDEEIQVISSDDEEKHELPHHSSLPSEQAEQLVNSPSPPEEPQNPQVPVPLLFRPWQTHIPQIQIRRSSISAVQQNNPEDPNAADIALDNQQMEKVLPLPGTSYPVDYSVRSEVASQLQEHKKSNEDSAKSVPNRSDFTGSKAKLTTRRNDEWPTYPCTECGRQFGTLYVHQTLHSNKSPFKCDICEKSFRHKQSLLELSDNVHENLVDELNHAEHAAHPHFEINNEEEKEESKDLLHELDPLTSPVSPLNVASHHLGQNFSILGNTSCDTGDINCGYIMETVQAAPGELTSHVGRNLNDLGCINSGSSSSNISCNVGGVMMQFEQAAPVELTSQVLGYINFDSNATSCNVNRPPSVAVHQVEEVLTHERTTAPVDTTEQLEYASQLNKCQVQLIGKSCEIPQKNAANGRRNESTSYPCEECGKQFSRKGHLAEHLRVHTGERPYKCSQCGYVCTQAGSLTKHKRVHSDARPFKCSTCNATYKCKGGLADHQRTHSDARPFKCSICNAAFKYKNNLTYHQSRHAVKKFTCDICKKTFRRKLYLMDHKNIHTGEKPYECNECNETFGQRVQLSKHRTCCDGKQKSSR